jgi:hypothetical protein
MSGGASSAPDPTDNSHSEEAHSNLVTRLVVGGIAVALPALLWLNDTLFAGKPQTRGSLSGYYHTPARDLFVAALGVTGFFLITYMSGRKDFEYKLSLVAGIAVIAVAFLPTERPNLAETEPRCGDEGHSSLSGCTLFQAKLGEKVVAGIHFTSAAIFIACLTRFCFLFAKREKEEHKNDPQVGARHAAIHRACGIALLLAVAWIGIGMLAGEFFDTKLDILGFTPLYVGEVLSVYGFGLSWLVRSLDLFQGGVLERLLDRILASIRSPRTAS